MKNGRLELHETFQVQTETGQEIAYTVVGVRENNHKEIAIVKDAYGDVYFMKYAPVVKDTGDREKLLRHLVRESEFQLYYPYIERIQNVGEFVDGQQSYFCFAAEYVEGKDLVEFRKEQSWNTYENLAFTQMLQFFKGVRYYIKCKTGAHYHRDLKPANIMIDGKTYRVVIVDFDFAHSPESDATRNEVELNRRIHEKNKDYTERLKGKGTVGYMAPSNMWYEGTDMQREFYSIGRLLCYWLNGKPYYKADEGECDDIYKRFYMNDEENGDIAYGIDMKRMNREFQQPQYAPLMDILRRLTARVGEGYEDIDQIIADFVDFLEGYYREDRGSYLEVVNDPYLMEAVIEPPIAKIGYRVNNQDSRTVMYVAENAVMDVLVDEIAVIGVYNRQGKLYYIPYMEVQESQVQERGRLQRGDMLSGSWRNGSTWQIVFS